MGWPSRACLTCKKRRIKCDIVYPTCSRCRKSDRECTWDPEDDLRGLPFRSENTFASGRPRRPRRKDRADLGSSTSVSLAPPSPTPNVGQQSIVRSRARSPSVEIIPRPRSPMIEIGRPLSQSIAEQALNFWAYEWLHRYPGVPEIGHECGDHVLDQWKRASPDSSCHLALSAVSQAVFGRVRNDDKAFKGATLSYLQCIRKTRSEVAAAKPSAEEMDQLLVSVMLMSSFEVLMYDGRSRLRGASDTLNARFWKAISHQQGLSGVRSCVLPS
ncbi:hypothetical protein K431DRAFT_26331 [Polychaeton citri CBS 116435]|uniref:Zn(2)-C6 fungal-type domain-containing protein n=1 Tax=Polychaeton citri CBS 116435 TaxID=1314669 RepID=A0A9P4UKC9_9PEZI|nr:hypothetical protein K431DRAFT_26331 [Polychaeton citri CBS 116435]